MDWHKEEDNEENKLAPQIQNLEEAASKAV